MDELPPLVPKLGHIGVGLGLSLLPDVLRNVEASQAPFDSVVTLSSSDFKDPVVRVETFPGDVLPKLLSSQLVVGMKILVFECLLKIWCTSPCCKRMSRW